MVQQYSQPCTGIAGLRAHRLEVALQGLDLNGMFVDTGIGSRQLRVKRVNERAQLGDRAIRRSETIGELTPLVLKALDMLTLVRERVFELTLEGIVFGELISELTSLAFKAFDPLMLVRQRGFEPMTGTISSG